MHTPLEAAKAAMNAARSEQGGTCKENGSGNPFSGCEKSNKYDGHNSASYGGVSGKENANGSGNKAVGGC